MPRVVSGDSARTVQIFANLIANSVKFTSGEFDKSCKHSSAVFNLYSLWRFEHHSCATLQNI